jgi:RNA polymerase sigma factor (sigma-70 family)
MYENNIMHFDLAQIAEDYPAAETHEYSCTSHCATTDYLQPIDLGADRRPAAELRSELDDSTWISRVQNGDEEAAKALVDRLFPTVIRSVRSRRTRQTEEEDMVQVIFAKTFSKLHQFSGLVPLEHWVSRIAVHACLSQLQREMVRPELQMGELGEEAIRQHASHPEEEPTACQAQAKKELLQRILNRLKPDERRVITLLHLEEKSVQEVSDLTGWPASRIKVKAFRTRHKMRKLWRGMFKAEEL